MGGFGSAVLEWRPMRTRTRATSAGWAFPTKFIEHGERGELLADLGLDAAGIAAACRESAGAESPYAGFPAGD